MIHRKTVKLNFVEHEYPLRYIAVKMRHDDCVPDEYIEFYSDKTGMIDKKDSLPIQ